MGQPLLSPLSLTVSGRYRAVFQISLLCAIAIVILLCVPATSAQVCDVGQCPELAQCSFAGHWEGAITLDLTQSGSDLTGTSGLAPVTGSVLNVYTPSETDPPTIVLQVGSVPYSFGISDCNHWLEGESSTQTGLTETKAICDLGLPGSLTAFPGGGSSNTSASAMRAFFAPTENGEVITLAKAARNCGYTGFEWQQEIFLFPNYHNRGCPSVGEPPPSFLDPCDGYIDPKTLKTYHTYPFYGADKERSDPTVLVFFDQPVDSRVGNGYMEFETRLVGRTPSNFFGEILARWTWISTYNSYSGGAFCLDPTGICTEAALEPPGTVGGTGGVTLTSINGVPVTNFSFVSNKLETTSKSFQLVSDFTLGGTSDGVNPISEATALMIGSYSVAIPANSFHRNTKGNYVFEGTIRGERLQLQIVPNTSTSLTLKAEGSGPATISLDGSPFVGILIGNDIGVGAATLNK